MLIRSPTCWGTHRWIGWRCAIGWIALLIVPVFVTAKDAPVVLRATEPDVDTVVVPIAELARDLSALADEDAERLDRFLKSRAPLPADSQRQAEAVATRRRVLGETAAEVVALGERLLGLTIEEAGRLGAMLDRDYGGKRTVFARGVFERQLAARKAIVQIQSRMAAEDQLEARIENPIVMRDVAANWEDAALGKEHWQEVVGLNFGRDFPDSVNPEMCDFYESDAEHVAMLTGVRSLNLAATEITDAGLARLARLVKLRDLNLHDAKRITDAGLKPLAALRALENVRLSDTNLDGSGLVHLLGCAKLRVLSVTSPALGDAAFPLIARMKSLEVLGLGPGAATRIELGVLPKLHELVIRDSQVRRVAIQAMPELRRLSLQAHVATEIRLVDLPLLSELSVPGSKGPRTLAIEGTPELARLSLGEAELDDAASRMVGQLSELRELYIHGGISDRHFAQFEKLGKLEKLTIVKKSLSDAGMETLGKLTALGELHLTTNGATDAGLEHLASLKKLRVAVIRGLNGSGEGLAALGKLPELAELQVDGDPLETIDLEGWPALRMLRFGGSKTTTLRLRNLPKLAHVDASIVPLKKIDIRDAPALGWVHLSICDAEKIESVSLRRLPALGALTLIPISRGGGIGGLPHRANITDEALRFASSMPRLQQVNLSNSKITDRSLACLAKCTEIQNLDVEGTDITDAGLPHLEAMPGLMFFGTSGTKVTSEARRRLKQVVPSLHHGE